MVPLPVFPLWLLQTLELGPKVDDLNLFVTRFNFQGYTKSQSEIVKLGPFEHSSIIDISDQIFLTKFLSHVHIYNQMWVT